jgi:transposase-like protein
LVISDAHAGLVEAIGTTLPGAGWQRCRTHYLRNPLARDDLLALPASHLWRQIWSNNPQEHLNTEIRGAPTWSGPSPTGPRSSALSAPS